MGEGEAVAETKAGSMIGSYRQVGFRGTERERGLVITEAPRVDRSSRTWTRKSYCQTFVGT